LRWSGLIPKPLTKKPPLPSGSERTRLPLGFLAAPVFP
jgi:hypothetical protein